MTDLIKITDLDTLESPADGDWVPVVDISDTTSGAGGTTKKITKAKLKGLNWQGAWSAGTYVLDDAVENDGSAWVCTAASTTEEPSAIAIDWDLLAAKGDTGATGSQGPQGDQGDPGTNGTDGEFITTFQGAWSAGTYTIGEIVTNAGSSWICTAASTTEEPTGTPTDWAKIADRGAQGPAGSGTGDMLEAIYDPTTVAGDAFDMDNMVEGANTKIMTAAERTRISALDAAVVLKGTWDASVGTFPGSGTAQAGESWIVSVTGTVDGVAFTAGDRIIAILDNASTTTYASNWFKADYTDLFTTTTLGDLINSATAKTTPVDADMVALMDSAASNVAKKLSWANIKVTLKTYIDSMTSTFTNKRVNPRTASSTTASTLTPDLSAANVYYRTTQTATLTIEAPIGTPVIGETIAIYVDSAGAQTLNMNAAYIPFGAAFPATTTAGKTLMITAQYNGTNWKTVWANAV